ncbi:hypothetical protein GE061_001785 [Apolygus lucorum]|uniref:Uncharacterized protein n=1 Tax=Apolygus lucorum TaxID=248454 RepID=A0A8S9X4P0_APOLU|nr:hypothetical protein GE061_001785 [Apolygus lucorum]
MEMDYDQVKSMSFTDYCESRSSDLNNNATDEMTESDEDMFEEHKEFKTIPDPKNLLDDEIERDHIVNRPISSRVGDSKTFEKSESSGEIVRSVNFLKLNSSVKKKVEFKKENEYFFFKETNSSTTHSSSDKLRGNRTASTEFNDNNLDDDDNAFDTGFLSPMLDFCSASPGSSQEVCLRKGGGSTDVFHEASAAVNGDESSQGSDNAFDTGFLSQDFCCPSPMDYQDVSLLESSVFTDHVVQVGSAANNKDKRSQDSNNAFNTSFLSENFRSGTPTDTLRQLENVETIDQKVHVTGGILSQDSDNAFDTGFLSQDSCSVSPLKSQIINPDKPTTFEMPSEVGANQSCPLAKRIVSSNDNENAHGIDVLSLTQDLFESPNDKKRATKKELGDIRTASTQMIQFEDNSSDDDIQGFDLSVRNIRSAGRLETLETTIEPAERPHALERYSATTHDMANSRSEVVSTDRTISRAISEKSDDEVFSQASAMTEIFSTSILVDLRIPGAFETIKEEYKKMVDAISSQNPFIDRKREPRLDLSISSIGNRKSELGCQRNHQIGLNDSNSIICGLKHTLALMTNLNQDRVINSQEELMEIRKLALNSVDNDSVKNSVEANFDNGPSKVVEPVNVSKDRLAMSPNFDDEMSKIVERINVSSGPLVMSPYLGNVSRIVEKLSVSCRPSGINSEQSRVGESNDFDRQYGSLAVPPHSSVYIEESASESSNKNMRRKLDFGRVEKFKISNEALNTPTLASNPFATPLSTTKIEKLTTPLGRKRLPLKKRHLLASPKLSLRGFDKEIGGVLSGQALIGDEREQIPTNKSAEREGKTSIFSTASKPTNENKIDVAMECESPIRDSFPEKNLDVTKTKKNLVDLAYKLSLPHISELFFNDPDVSTKYREGSICFTASRATSSKSTCPRKSLIEEFPTKSNPNFNIAHEFEELDLNPPRADGPVEKCFEDSVTSEVSALETGGFSSGKSDQTDSEVGLNSDFVEDFLENAQHFLASRNARVEQICDQENIDPRRAASDAKMGNKRQFSRAITPKIECRSVQSSTGNSDVNFKSIRFPVGSPSGVSSKWWNFENTTRNSDVSSRSDDSLRVLLSTSQPKAKSSQPLRPAENQGNSSISSETSTKHSRSDVTWGRHDDGSSKISDQPCKDPNAEESLRKTDQQIEAAAAVRKIPARKRTSIVVSHVIMKPAGADRQSKDYDSFIFED